MSHARLLSIAWLLVACGGVPTGRASGTCRITYGSVDPAPTIEEVVRTDTLAIDVARATGDDLRVTLPGCELVAHPVPGEPHGYTITRGHCHVDVPGAGMRDFDVQAMERDPSATEGTSTDASLSIGDQRDVSLIFEASLSPGQVRYVCDAAIP